MSTGIVDHFELVQIHETQHVPLIGPRRLIECALDPSFQLTPVGEVGKHVMSGLVFEGLGQVMRLGDIACDTTITGEIFLLIKNGFTRAR